MQIYNTIMAELILNVLQKIEPRKGNTALHSSFQHLSSKDSNWDTILVGWTGKIQPISKAKLPSSTAGLKSPLKPPLIGTQSQSPKPLLRRTTTFFSQGGNRTDAEIVKVTGEDRDFVERMLIDESATPGGYGKAVPVWLGEDDDGGLTGLTVGEGGERWGMLSQKGVTSFSTFSLFPFLLSFSIIRDFVPD